MGAVGGRDHVSMIPVEIPLPGTVPTRVAVGLGVKAGMVAIRKTLGTAITSRFAAGIDRGDQGCAITGGAETVHIPEQAKLRRNGKELGFKESKQAI